MTWTDTQQQAVARLWELRAQELTWPGDSSPARIAERRLHDLVYQVCNPPQADAPVTLQHDHPDVVPLRLAAGIRPPQQVVTGEDRATLLQWLPEVVRFTTTLQQRMALDGWRTNEDHFVVGSLDSARELLAGEGFAGGP